MALTTRKPTGRAGWPKILVEGTDKSGKSWSLAQLSASPKVGRTVVLILGEDETRWDEYGKIPGARFEIAVHDGSWKAILGAAEDAKEEPPAPAITANAVRFRHRHHDRSVGRAQGLGDLPGAQLQTNKLVLAQDPDAEIDVTSNYWNDSKRRHRGLMRILLTFPGIVVLIARGSEVTMFQNGQPVANRKTWSVEAEKNLPFDVSTHIRLSRDSRPLLVSASGVHCQIRPGIDPPRRLPDDWSLESVIFDTLKLDAASAGTGEFVEMTADVMTPEQIRDEACGKHCTYERTRELYRIAFNLRYAGVTLVGDTGDEEELLKLLTRLGAERKPAAPQAPAAAQPAVAAANGHGAS